MNEENNNVSGEPINASEPANGVEVEANAGGEAQGDGGHEEDHREGR